MRRASSSRAAACPIPTNRRLRFAIPPARCGRGSTSVHRPPTGCTSHRRRRHGWLYVHREAQQWLAGLAGAKIHRADALQLFAIDRSLVASCAARLDRRMSLAVAISGQELFVSFADETISGAVTRLTL